MKKLFKKNICRLPDAPIQSRRGGGAEGGGTESQSMRKWSGRGPKQSQEQGTRAEPAEQEPTELKPTRMEQTDCSPPGRSKRDWSPPGWSRRPPERDRRQPDLSRQNWSPQERSRRDWSTPGWSRRPPGQSRQKQKDHQAGADSSPSASITITGQGRVLRQPSSRDRTGREFHRRPPWP